MNPTATISANEPVNEIDSTSEIDRDLQREEEGRHEATNWKDARKGSDWRKNKSADKMPTLEDGAD